MDHCVYFWVYITLLFNIIQFLVASSTQQTVTMFHLDPEWGSLPKCGEVCPNLIKMSVMINKWERLHFNKSNKTVTAAAYTETHMITYTLTVSISAWVSTVIAFSTTMISGCTIAIAIFISPPAAVCVDGFWPPPNTFHSQELPNTYNCVHQKTRRSKCHADSKDHCETAQTADQNTISTSKTASKYARNERRKYSGIS